MADVGIEYGIALYNLALENNKLSDVKEDLDSIKSALKEEPKYIKLLLSPAISKSERYSLIDKAFDSADPIVVSFLKTLVKNNQVNQFFDATYHFNVFYNEKMNIKKVSITSSEELSSEQKEKIESILKKKENATLITEYSIDKNILGGIIININGKQYDGSLKKKLNEIQKVMFI